MSGTQTYVTGYFQENSSLLTLVPTGTYAYSVPGGYPVNTTLLSAGSLYYDGGYIGVVPGITPNPTAIPPSYPGVTPQGLLDFGGGNLPLSPQSYGTLWNNGLAVCISFPPVIFDPWWLQKSLKKTINSYLYVQYNDDAALQAFVDAYNGLTQKVVNWFNTVNLPIYTGAQISGTLLDWVATGLYGQARPIFTTGSQYQIGPPNTATLNQIGPNQSKSIGIVGYYQASDDIYKRILTWNFYKGDGRNFTASWLKRRIARFLLGANGTAPNIDFTPGISVTFGVSLTHVPATTYGIGALNTSTLNQIRLNGQRTIAVPGRYSLTGNTINITLDSSVRPLAAILKSAILGGAVQLPFQFKFNVTVV